MPVSSNGGLYLGPIICSESSKTNLQKGTTPTHSDVGRTVISSLQNMNGCRAAKTKIPL